MARIRIRALDGSETVVEVETTEPAANPTPLQWMDRLPRARQVVLHEALQATPEGRLFALRLAAAKDEIDPRHPETIAGVQMLLAARVLTDAEAAALLA
jgi:hypothetical protein